MLSSLLIKNYALIRHLEMQPAAGLNIITGETGAGKSIMLGAVGLLMGNRADIRVLLQKEHKCVVEGAFNLVNYGLETLFRQNDWDYEPSTIIRREISSSGKSRAFINDSPVNLEALRSLGAHLLDVHSQNDTLKLGGQEFQLQVLDIYGDNRELLDRYQQQYQQWTALKAEHQRLLSRSGEQQKEADYRNFLLNELEAANLDPAEQEHLEESLRLMENAEEIKLQIQGCLQALEQGDYGASQQLSGSIQMLVKIAGYASQYQSLKERLESMLIEIRDITGELEHLDRQVEHDPKAIEELSSRLDTIYRLQKKHGVNSVQQLIDIREQLSQASEQLLHLDDTLKGLEKQIASAETTLMALGRELDDKRKATFPGFKQRMEDLLVKLGMQESTLALASEKSGPGPNGINKIQWRFSANKGVAPQPIDKVASGGEFSRLMFCVKYLIADKIALPTILFDEIDTGISGEVALQMIGMMHRMARSHQVITISHLPQFAARGDHHYFVYKESDDHTTTSGIKRLTGRERVEAVAAMLGGNNPSEIAYANARELLGTGE